MSRTITYGDLHIGSCDLAYIEKLEEVFRYNDAVDSWDAELYSLQGDYPCIANDIIYHMQYTGVYNLPISEKSQEKLADSIYTNCIDSGFNIDISEFPKKERKIIQEFIDIF